MRKRHINSPKEEKKIYKDFGNIEGYGGASDLNDDKRDVRTSLSPVLSKFPHPLHHSLIVMGMGGVISSRRFNSHQ